MKQYKKQVLIRKSRPVLAIREKVSLAASTFGYYGLKTTLEPPAEIQVSRAGDSR